MTLDEAIDYVDWWEGEDYNLNPTKGSEDEPNIPGTFTPLGGVVVYSFLTQNQILVCKWFSSEFIQAVKDTLHEKGDSDAPIYMLWRQRRLALKEVTGVQFF